MGNNFLAAGQDATSPEAVDSTSDVAALARVRAGDPTAFEVLYLRHHDSARALARRQVDNPADADVVVAEAFTSILNSLVEGKGPDTFFRAYLFTTVRRTAYKRNTANARVRMTDEDSVLETVIFDKDTVVAEFESTAMSTAFFSLPERWQLVLWHVDIEEMKPAAVAPILGLSANGISSLAIRAREGLRRAYLQNHVAAAAGGCAEFAGSLGAFARNGLKRSTHESVQEHLLGCSGCTAALLEVNDVQAGMRAHVFPLVAGLGFSSAFTAAAGGSGALLGSNAQPGVGVAARKSVLGSPKVLVGAALAVALMVLVALTGWLNRPAPEPYVVGAPMPTAQTSPAATLAPSPSASPSASSSSASPAPQSTTPAPPVESAPAPTAEAPVASASRPAPSPSKRPATVSVPEVLVQATKAPTQAPPVPPLQTVSAVLTSNSDGTDSRSTLGVSFSLQGQGNPSSAAVAFMLPAGASFVSNGWQAPAGWTCAAQSAARLDCTTAAADPAALSFTLPVSIPTPSTVRRLNFTLSGQGIMSQAFSNTFA